MKTNTYAQQLELFQLFEPVNIISSQSKFTFIDLFAGIGGFRIPLQELGGICLGYSEIDKEAIKVYQNNFIRDANADEPYLGDITNLNKLPFEIDLLVGGVPCQPWSIAGKLQGLDDPRGKLWIDVFRVVRANQPKAFIFENVKGLTEPRNRKSNAVEYLSRFSSNGELKPFQAALIPPELIRINQFERGLSTKLGNSFEECARLIALQHHQSVRLFTISDRFIFKVFWKAMSTTGYAYAFGNL